MSYTINPNAKNRWARNADNTMDLSLETDASSVYLDNGRTLEQELGEGSMVSNVATVDTSMSKVIDGTLDGVYESCVLKGKSLVNVAQPFDRSITDVWASIHLRHSLLKQSTKYYYQVFDLPSGFQHVFTNSDGSTFLGTYTTNNISTFTTNLELTSDRIVLHINDGGKNALTQEQLGKIKVMVIEYQQGMENWDIPYFTGLCDVKMPILRNVGKNLFDVEKVISLAPNEIKAVDEGIEVINGVYDLTSALNISPDKQYTVGYSFERISGVGRALFAFTYEDGSIQYIDGSENGRLSTASHKGKKIKRFELTYSDIGVTRLKKIQLEESSTATTYEDHKTNILHTPETVTLRSLPNGVRDELNLKTGECTKRIKEIVLDGSEKWMNFRDETDTTWRTSFSLPDAEPSSVCICDKFVYSKGATEERVKIYVTSTPKLSITVLKSEFPDLASFKEWLLVNKPVVQYQLATPITTKVVSTQSEPIVKIGTELPNGVCDTYNLLTGEHIQRVGKVVLDGSEDWLYYQLGDATDTICFRLMSTNIDGERAKANAYVVSDRFAQINRAWNSVDDYEGLTFDTPTPNLYMRILKSRLSANDVNSFKQWLKENPTTVYYELANPIITKKNGLPNTHGVTLPSGVVDKYNESTGVYTQNLGKVVLDGSQDEEWTIVSSLSLTNTIAFQFMLSQGSSSRADNLICNSFTPQEGSSDIEHIRSAWAEDGVYKAIALFINKTKLPTQDVSGLRSYLASNNIELYYLLPASKTIDIPLINVGQVLPNGACDTYNPITKEYVKRINKVMFDGSEDEGWVSGSNTTDTYFDGWGAVIPDIKAYSSNLIFHSNLLCDRLSPSTYEQYNEHIAVQSPTGIVSIGLYSSRLTTVNLSGFKTWLKLNPLTVWYELATPEISFVDIDLSTLYSSSPIAYENGHIILESGHDGQSLLPTLEYSTITNRVKQIESISEQVLRQEKQLTMLEQMLIQNIINLDYNNTLLTLKNEMEEML